MKEEMKRVPNRNLSKLLFSLVATEMKNTFFRKKPLNIFPSKCISMLSAVFRMFLLALSRVILSGFVLSKILTEKLLLCTLYSTQL